MIQQDTRVRWIVAVDGEVRFTTETDNRDEAQIWADHNLEPDTDYESRRHAIQINTPV